MKHKLFVCLLLAVVITTWPWVLSPSSVLGKPSMEAVEHLWTLWLTTTGAGLLNLHTDMVQFPSGFQWVLADPINLVWFIPFEIIGGAPFAFGVVLWINLFLAGSSASKVSRGH